MYLDCVAAEVAQEITVLFEHEHRDPGARQQKTEHDPGRAAAGDAAGDSMRLVCHTQPCVIMPPGEYHAVVSNGDAGMETHRVRIINRLSTRTPQRSVSCLSRSSPVGCGDLWSVPPC